MPVFAGARVVATGVWLAHPPRSRHWYELCWSGKRTRTRGSMSMRGKAFPGDHLRSTTDMSLADACATGTQSFHATPLADPRAAPAASVLAQRVVREGDPERRRPQPAWHAMSTIP